MNRIAFNVGSKSALRRNTDTFLLQISKDFSCFVDTPGDLLGILEFSEFGADQAKDDRLVFGKVSQGFKVARTGSIICS